MIFREKKRTFFVHCCRRHDTRKHRRLIPQRMCPRFNYLLANSYAARQRFSCSAVDVDAHPRAPVLGAPGHSGQHRATTKKRPGICEGLYQSKHAETAHTRYARTCVSNHRSLSELPVAQQHSLKPTSRVDREGARESSSFRAHTVGGRPGGSRPESLAAFSPPPSLIAPCRRFWGLAATHQSVLVRRISELVAERPRADGGERVRHGLPRREVRREVSGRTGVKTPAACRRCCCLMVELSCVSSRKRPTFCAPKRPLAPKTGFLWKGGFGQRER